MPASTLPIKHGLATPWPVWPLLLPCRSARLDLPAAQAARVAASLSLPALLQLLAAGFVSSPAANYGCRAAAVQLLLEVLLVLRGARAAADEQVRACAVAQRATTTATPRPADLHRLCTAGDAASAQSGHTSQAAPCPTPYTVWLCPPPQAPLLDGLLEPLLACLSGLLSHVCAGRAGAAFAPASAGGAAAPGAAAPVKERQGGFNGKGLLRLGLHCVGHLTVLLPAQRWAPLWQQVWCGRQPRAGVAMQYMLQ